MKKFVKQIMAMLLAFVVLFSTVSFTVDKHYCCKRLVDVSILTKAKSCGMDIASKDSTSNSFEFKKETCCENETIIVEGQDELKPTFDSLELEQQLFLESFVYSYFSLFTAQVQDKPQYNLYLPPLLVKDIQVLDEVYLI